MSEIESSSKKGRTDFDSGRDRLSGLPLSIIHIILSLLPIRDAVRTMILSRNWKYTRAWATLPNLVFDETLFSSKESMANFVTNTLKHHKGPIFKFEMSVSLRRIWPILDDWLLFLPRNEIRELILKLGTFDANYHYRNWHQVRSIVHSCNKLTHLELYKCNVRPPPLSFTRFLFLRCLILEDVYIFTEDVECLVSGSPLLETLKLINCGDVDPSPKLRINAQKLKYLNLEGETGAYIEIDLCAPLLAELFVSVKDRDDAISDYLEKKSSIYNYTNLIGGCTNLEKLRGELYFTKIMSISIESWKESFVFHRLKVIKLEDIHLNDVKEMTVVARLIIGAPNLEKLDISGDYNMMEYSEEEEEAQEVSYMDFLSAHSLKWEKLRFIRMSYLAGLPSEVEFLQFLLESSPVLEWMSLGTTLAFKEIKKLEVRNIEVQSCFSKFHALVLIKIGNLSKKENFCIE